MAASSCWGQHYSSSHEQRLVISSSSSPNFLYPQFLQVYMDALKDTININIIYSALKNLHGFYQTFDNKIKNFLFLMANVSLDTSEGHLEGSNGRKRLIRITKDDVQSALSKILSIRTFNAFRSWLPSSMWGTLSSNSQSRSSVIRLSRVLSLTACGPVSFAN